MITSVVERLLHLTNRFVRNAGWRCTVTGCRVTAFPAPLNAGFFVGSGEFGAQTGAHEAPRSEER